MQSTAVTNESLLKIVERLENAVSKLEGKTVQSNAQAAASQVNVGTALLTTEKIMAYTDFWNKTLKLLLELKAAATETAAPEIEQITEAVLEVICAQQDVLVAVESFKKPVNNDLKTLQKKIYSYVAKIEEIGRAKRDFSLHTDAVKNGLDALNWLYSDNSCDMITQTFLESIDFAGNKIFMKKIPTQTKWVKLFKSIINELDLFVKANYKSGLVWSSKGDGDVSNLILTIGNTYRKNFKIQQQAQEEAIPTETVQVDKTPIITTTVIPATNSANTKAVTKPAEKKADSSLQIQDMITSGAIRNSLKPINKPEEKKEAPKVEPVPVVVPVVSAVETKDEKKPLVTKGRRQTIWKKGKKEVFEESKQQFVYENLEGEIRELDPEQLSMKTSIHISNCFKSTFKISKKVKKIILNNCEEVNIICHSLITLFEVINSVKVKVQVEGTINCFSIDGSTDVVLQLSSNCAEAQFVTSNSNLLKVRLAKEEDPTEFTENIIPEQLVFSINKDKKLDVKISDNYNY